MERNNYLARSNFALTAAIAALMGTAAAGVGAGPFMTSSDGPRGRAPQRSSFRGNNTTTHTTNGARECERRRKQMAHCAALRASRESRQALPA